MWMQLWGWVEFIQDTFDINEFLKEDMTTESLRTAIDTPENLIVLKNFFNKQHNFDKLFKFKDTLLVFLESTWTQKDKELVAVFLETCDLTVKLSKEFNPEAINVTAENVIQVLKTSREYAQSEEGKKCLAKIELQWSGKMKEIISEWRSRFKDVIERYNSVFQDNNISELAIISLQNYSIWDEMEKWIQDILDRYNKLWYNIKLREKSNGITAAEVRNENWWVWIWMLWSKTSILDETLRWSDEWITNFDVAFDKYSRDFFWSYWIFDILNPNDFSYFVITPKFPNWNDAPLELKLRTEYYNKLWEEAENVHIPFIPNISLPQIDYDLSLESKETLLQSILVWVFKNNREIPKEFSTDADDITTIESLDEEKTRRIMKYLSENFYIINKIQLSGKWTLELVESVKESKLLTDQQKEQLLKRSEYEYEWIDWTKKVRKVEPKVHIGSEEWPLEIKILELIRV